MSYILSALRKAELERHKEHTSDRAKSGWSTLYTRPDRQNGKTRYWLIPVGLMLVIATGLALFFYGDTTSKVAPSKSHSTGLTVDPGNIPTTIPAINEQSASLLAPDSNDTDPSHIKPLVTSDSPASSPALATRPLPEQSGQSLPSLTITGYIYFEDNPDASEVLINGIVYRLGSSISEGVNIQAFRPNVLVVSYRGNLHEISVNH